MQTSQFLLVSGKSVANRRNVKSEKTSADRYGGRDHLLLLMIYRHGPRVSEVTALKLADLDLQQARLWMRRLKNGLSVEHP
jgi:site-specific recombinase XerD